jgi:hypothetical protein
MQPSLFAFEILASLLVFSLLKNSQYRTWALRVAPFTSSLLKEQSQSQSQTHKEDPSPTLVRCKKHKLEMNLFHLEQASEDADEIEDLIVMCVKVYFYGIHT